MANQKVHYTVTTIYVSYFGMPFTSAACILLLATGLEKKDTTIPLVQLIFQIVYLLIAGTTGTLAQVGWNWKNSFFFGIKFKIFLSKVFFNISLKHEDASKIAIIRSADFFFTYLFQYLWLDVTQNFYNGLGCCLIVLGTLIILIFKILDKQIGGKQALKQPLWKRIVFFKF